MDRIAKLKEQLIQTVGTKVSYPIFGTVKSIQGDTCTVSVNGLELSDVRLKTTADGAADLLLVPAENSRVMMLSTDGSIDNLTIVKMDKVDKILSANGSFKMEIDLVGGKIGMRNSTTGLYELFNQLQAILKNLKVYTPTGPSGSPLPTSIVAIAEFENDFKTILKQL